MQPAGTLLAAGTGQPQSLIVGGIGGPGGQVHSQKHMISLPNSSKTTTGVQLSGQSGTGGKSSRVQGKQFSLKQSPTLSGPKDDWFGI